MKTVLKKNSFKSSKNHIFISLTLLLIVLAIIVICIFSYSNSLDKRLQVQLDLGYKYLEELNYEQAIATFENMIYIDPKNVEAYKGLIDAYTRNGNEQLALETAQRALDETDNVDFQCIIDELSAEAVSSEEMLDANPELVTSRDSENIQNNEENETVLISEIDDVIMDDVVLEDETDGTIEEDISSENEKNGFIYVPVESRSNYCDYYSLSTGEQSFIELMFDAILNENCEKIQDIPVSQYLVPKEFFTTYKGYKIRVRFSNQLVLIEEGTEEIIDIEIRPENGIGYSLAYDTYTGWRTDMQGNRGYKDNYTLEWGRCNCSEWVFSGEGYYYRYSFESDGFEKIITGSGMMENGLRNGVWTNTWKLWGNVENSGQGEALYINGREEPYTSIETLITSYGSDTGEVDQWIWNNIHW